MSQITFYLDEKLHKKLDQVVKREGKNRSVWIKEAIEDKINAPKAMPEWWFKLWGSWEDVRGTEEIIRDIKSGYAETKRQPLK